MVLNRTLFTSAQRVSVALSVSHCMVGAGLSSLLREAHSPCTLRLVLNLTNCRLDDATLASIVERIPMAFPSLRCLLLNISYNFSVTDGIQALIVWLMPVSGMHALVGTFIQHPKVFSDGFMLTLNRGDRPNAPWCSLLHAHAQKHSWILHVL